MKLAVVEFNPQNHQNGVNTKNRFCVDNALYDRYEIWILNIKNDFHVINIRKA